MIVFDIAVASSPLVNDVGCWPLKLFTAKMIIANSMVCVWGVAVAQFQNLFVVLVVV